MVLRHIAEISAVVAVCSLNFWADFLESYTSNYIINVELDCSFQYSSSSSFTTHYVYCYCYCYFEAEMYQTSFTNGGLHTSNRSRVITSQAEGTG